MDLQTRRWSKRLIIFVVIIVTTVIVIGREFAYGQPRVGGLTEATRPDGESSQRTQTSCPVTKSNGWQYLENPKGGNYGNQALGTILPSFGVVDVDTRRTPGHELSIKLGWWRLVPGQLTITARRLDGNAAAIRAVIPQGYGTRGFQSSRLIFPSVGCWQITGHIPGNAALNFVIQVRTNS